MKQLKITKNPDLRLMDREIFPNLEKTFSDIEILNEEYVYSNIIKSILYSNLNQDLYEIQYKKIIQETISKVKDFLIRLNHNPNTYKSLEWCIRGYMYENYFCSGLFLDDIRNPLDVCNYYSEIDQIQYITREWGIVRSFEEFKNYLNNNDIPLIISLDHDLGFGQKLEESSSGYDACKFLVDLLIDNEELCPPRIYSHSQNPVGKNNILAYYSNYIKSRK
ncbi:cyclic-phosphate processing receiver domain-containing protein [Sphingobacterium kyonggiense]